MKRIAFCLSLVLNVYPVFAQLSQLKQRFQESGQRQPEKIHLHTDRSFYAAADTVWYKAYLLNPQTQAPHPVSEILYLDLLSEDNRSIISQRLKTENGYKAGSLILPDTLKTGNYLLQVYSNYQRNAGPDAFFRQRVWVNKVPKHTAETIGNTTGKGLQEIRFFPEGGKLLAGFESKVGFKAINVSGASMPVEGKIVDEAGKVVVNFRSHDSGFGSFIFRPQPGKSYRAEVLAGGEKKEFPLEVAEKGYVLSLKNSPDSVTVFLAAAEKTTTPMYMVLQGHGNLLAADSIMFNARGFRKCTFSTKNWPEGIVQVSLLNNAEKPETERLFFHRKAKPLQVKLETAKKNYGRREAVPVNLSLVDEDGKPIAAEFSVSVTSNLPNISPTLKENILLISETGEIPFFSLNDVDGLDNLLLTQKLRDFSWETTAISGKPVPAFARETELGQTGLVAVGEELVKNAVIYLLETNSGKTHLLISNAAGQFRMPTEGSRFFYQVWQNGALRENAGLILLKTESVLPADKGNMELATDSVQTKRMTLRRQIDNMYAFEAAKPKAKFVNKDMWPAYPANHYYPLEEYNQLNTMEEILREMVPSVRVITRKKKVQANVYNEDTRTFYPNQPLYIIDGQPTWNNDLFLRLDASQLEQVNIYNSSKMLQPFGFMGNNGVIVVFTKSRNFQSPDLSSENILKIPGQNSSNQFKIKERPANIPDFRPTLYWNPALQTDAGGKASFTFRTTDEMGNMRVQVEGITKDGRLISDEIVIPVQPAE